MSLSQFEYGEEDPDSIKIDKFDDEMLRKVNLATMFQQKKVTIEVDVKRADPLIDNHFKMQPGVLGGIRDLEYVNFYEIEFEEQRSDGYGDMTIGNNVGGSVPHETKKANHTSKIKGTNGGEAETKFADNYDPKDRIFYMNSATIITRKPGEVSHRVKRVGEELEGELIRSDEELKMLSKAQASLNEEETYFLDDIPRDLNRSINRFITVQRKGISTIMKATSKSSNNDSPRGQINKLIEHSMDLCDRTKFNQKDAIKLKTSQEIIEFSKQSLSFDSQLLEPDLFKEITRVTTENPSVEWMPKKEVNYNFVEPEIKVKMSLSGRLDALGKHLEVERQKVLALERAERERAHKKSIGLRGIAKAGRAVRRMSSYVPSINESQNERERARSPSVSVTNQDSVWTANNSINASITNENIPGGTLLSDYLAEDCSVMTRTSKVSAIRTPKPPQNPAPSKASSSVRPSPMKANITTPAVSVASVASVASGKSNQNSTPQHQQQQRSEVVGDKDNMAGKKIQEFIVAPAITTSIAQSDNIIKIGNNAIVSADIVRNIYNSSNINNDNNNGSPGGYSHSTEKTNRKLELVSNVLENFTPYQTRDHSGTLVINATCINEVQEYNRIRKEDGGQRYDDKNNNDDDDNNNDEAGDDNTVSKGSTTARGDADNDIAHDDNDANKGMLIRKKNYMKSKEEVESNEKNENDNAVSEAGSDGRHAHFLPSFDDDTMSPTKQYFCFPIKVVNSKKSEGSMSTTPASKPYSEKEINTRIAAAVKKVTKANDNNKICKSMAKQLKDPVSMELSHEIMQSGGDKTFINFALNAHENIKNEVELCKQKTIQILQKSIDATNNISDKKEAFIAHKIHFEETKLRHFQERAFFQHDKIADTFKALVDNEEKASRALDKSIKATERASPRHLEKSQSVLSDFTGKSRDGFTFMTDIPVHRDGKGAVVGGQRNVSASLLLARKASGISPTGKSPSNAIANVVNGLEKALPLASNIQMFMNVKIKQFEKNEKDREDGLLLSNKWYLILVTRLKANMIKQRKQQCEPCLIELLTVVKTIIIRKVRLTKKIVLDLMESLIPKEKFEVNIIYCVLLTLCNVVDIDKETFYKYLLKKSLPVAHMLQADMDRLAKFRAAKAASMQKAASAVKASLSLSTVANTIPNSNSRVDETSIQVGATRSELGMNGDLMSASFSPTSSTYVDVAHDSLFFAGNDIDIDIYDDNDASGFTSIAESLQSSVADLNLFKEEVWLKL